MLSWVDAKNRKEKKKLYDIHRIMVHRKQDKGAYEDPCAANSNIFKSLSSLVVSVLFY